MLIRKPDGSLVARVKVSADTASGGRRGYVKTCTRAERAAQGLYAAAGGEMLRDGEHDFPVGTVVAEVSPGGSVKRPTKSYRVAVVDEAGDLNYGSPLGWSGSSHPQFCDAIESALAAGEALRAESETLAALQPGQVRGDYLRLPDVHNGAGTKVPLVYFGKDAELATAVRAYAESGADWAPVLARRAELVAAKADKPTLTALREAASGQALSRRLRLEAQRDELLQRLAAVESELAALTPAYPDCTL